VALAFLVPIAGGTPVHADTTTRLNGAKGRVQALVDRIRTAEHEQAALQARLEAMAREFSHLESQISETGVRIAAVQRQVAAIQTEVSRQQDALNARATLVYEEGPATTLDFLLGSTSIGDLTNRLEIVDAAAASDERIITQLVDAQNELRARQSRLVQLQGTLQTTKQNLAASSKQLTAKLVAQKKAVASLERAKAMAERLESRLSAKLQRELGGSLGSGSGSGGSGGIGGVFQVCPVDAPHAYSDDFGAPRDGPPPHPHMGNDIFAPLGTPIRAPFPGTAVETNNGLGGRGVTVYGALGYAYNAHLSRYGALGAVAAGTIVGYVGNTGDAAGGPTHDHFEWHPGVIPANPWKSPYGYTVIDGAIDPFPYLNAVC
jgi:peptidoglycan hydrolase CwlO-like protein